MGNWIDVNDRLPPDGQEVLLFVKNDIGHSRFIVGYHLDDEWNYCVIFESYALDYFAVKVTHWMELPVQPDFSKADLSEIHRCLKYMTKGGVTPYSCHTISLVKKVKDMINNYSETATPKKDVT